MYLDEYRPVKFAALPRKAPTIPAVTFLTLLGGQFLEVWVPQSFTDGNADIRWRKGAAITATSQGLWEPMGHVQAEDIRQAETM